MGGSDTFNFAFFRLAFLLLLSSSMTKIRKPPDSNILQKAGIPSAIFLDNGLGGVIEYSSCKIYSLAVHSDLFKSGIVPNQEKSVWEKVQVITWLGVILNTIKGSV